MKGCLSLIIKTIIAVLVFFGLKYIGFIDYIQNKINEHSTVSQEEQVQKANDILDLSQIDDEYTIDRSFKILKNRVIIAQHNSSSQKMIILEPRNDGFLTKNDIKSDNIKEKVNNLIEKYAKKIIKPDKIEITQKGSFNALGQNIPFVKIKAEISNLPIKDMEGIVGVAQINSGKNLIILSVNEKNKYSQIITEAFFKKVKDAE